MKTVLFTFFIFGFSALFAFAQNKITVNQQGNGNNATISQGATEAQNEDCNEARLQASGPNEIVVKRSGSGSEAVIQSSDKTLNIVSDLLYAEKLSAYQYGSGNGLLLTLPDQQRAPLSLETEQRGSDNRISAKTGTTPNSVLLTQDGSTNNIAINPCDEQKAEKDERGNTVAVSQDGNGNSVSVTQN